MPLLFWGILFSGRFSLFLLPLWREFRIPHAAALSADLRAFYIIGLAYGFADFFGDSFRLLVAGYDRRSHGRKPGLLPAMLLIVLHSCCSM